MTDWLMAGCNPQRTSFQPDSLGATWSFGWEFRHHVDLSPREKVWAGLEPIVAQGHVLVPTLMGKLRSFQASASSPTIQWTADLGAPVVCTPAADTTNVYVADAYGRLSAWRLSDGANVWGPLQLTDGRPFRGAVLLADSKLMLGGADGKFYARHLDGTQAWAPYDLGQLTPILGGAAWSNNGGTNRVVFCAEDLKVRALDSGTGALLWTSAVLPGATAQLYWPVLSGAVVVMRPQFQYASTWVGSAPGPTKRGITADVGTLGAQTTALAAYDSNPSDYALNLSLLNLASGALHPAPIHFEYVFGHGSEPTPCIDRDGYAVIPVPLPASLSPEGWCNWGRLDIQPASGTFRKVVDVLYDNDTNSNHNAGDETLFATACSTGIVGMHCEEMNAAKSGFWAQPANAWTIFSKQPADNELFFNHQAPGAAPAAISGTSVYHLAYCQRLVCWRTS